jgi:hypothetical protein
LAGASLGPTTPVRLPPLGSAVVSVFKFGGMRVRETAPARSRILFRLRVSARNYRSMETNKAGTRASLDTPSHLRGGEGKRAGC